MPMIEASINVKFSDEEMRQLVLDLSSLSAEAIGKPEEYCRVTIRYDPFFSSGRTFDPAYNVTIRSMSVFHESIAFNDSVAQKFCAFFEERIGAADGRGEVFLISDEGPNVGKSQRSLAWAAPPSIFSPLHPDNLAKVAAARP